jgi:hypothetical protein
MPSAGAVATMYASRSVIGVVSAHSAFDEFQVALPGQKGFAPPVEQNVAQRIARCPGPA